MDGKEKEIVPSRTTELLAESNNKLNALIRGNSEGYYDKVQLEDGKELYVQAEYFYGGPGAPQCTIIARSVSMEGERTEKLFSWFRGNNQTNFLPAGYFIRATAPDQGLPILDADDSVRQPAEQTTGSITESDAETIKILVDQYLESLDEATQEQVRARNAEKLQLHLSELALALGEVVTAKYKYEWLLTNIQKEVLEDEQGLVTKLREMTNEEIQALINKANNHYSSRSLDLSQGMLGDIRNILNPGVDN